MIFQGIYLQKWSSQIPSNELYDLALESWDRAINKFSDECIAFALERSAETFKWPPSIAEFTELCVMRNKSLPESYFSIKKNHKD
jgi:hypothetical protein